MLTRFDPFAPFRLFDERFQNEIARFFEGSSRAFFAPPVDIYEDKEAFVLKAELPGMRPRRFKSM
ncbi:MAG: hypothetical protein NZM37_07920 [Sandaracinaceae bacterium]|nr:hypothetical protein [Sandaracinaceae bacterium]